MKEDLAKYQTNVKQDAKGAASDLQKIIPQIVSAVEKALVKGGPLISDSLLEDFEADLKEALKGAKKPIVSKLSDIMSDVAEKSEEIKAQEAEAEKAVTQEKQTEKAPVKTTK